MVQSLIQYFPYAIRSQGPRNAHDQISHQNGVLLKIENGYACLHPHPALGEPSLDDLIEDIKSNKPKFNLSLKALACAAIDGNARSLKKSLFEDSEIPKSHFLLSCTELNQNTLEKKISSLKSLAFNKIKIKLNSNLDENYLILDKLSRYAKDFKWRLDFNESLNKRSFQEFIQNLSADHMDHIDFIEDPFPYHPNEWALMESHYPIKLAKDFNSSLDPKGYSFIIHKSARDNPAITLELAKKFGKKVVVTHNMDHPLGVLYAAYEASKLSKEISLEECGLLWPEFFSYPDGTAPLSQDGPVLRKATGHGLGLDDYLKNLNWKNL
jgi:O-succinylbenzoate synthase